MKTKLFSRLLIIKRHSKKKKKKKGKNTEHVNVD